MGRPQCGATQIYFATQPVGLFPFQDSVLPDSEGGWGEAVSSSLSLVPSPIQAYIDISFSPFYSLLISFFYLPAGSYSWQIPPTWVSGTE